MSQALLWFRRDLRLADNPAWQALINEGHTPLPVYIHYEPDAVWQPGAASSWWLHHSLIALQKSLQKHGSDLLIFKGDPKMVLSRLLLQTGANRIAWNRRYEPAWIKHDASIRQAFEQQGCHVSSHNAALLRDPEEILKKDGTPYRVFTPFWKKLHGIGPARETITSSQNYPAPDSSRITDSMPVDSLNLLPADKRDKTFNEQWTPGEDGAWKALQHFTDNNLIDYATHRDMPACPGTSHLSPHLHFGEISPVQIWKTLSNLTATTTSHGSITATESWLRQIGWREFSYHLMVHFPATPLEPMDQRFYGFPWRRNYKNDLHRWQRGKTGIPLVDAGMRELWTTGYMHNRVRMITASFLVKNLLIPWQEGARWFWNTLVDADLANNTMGWQWTTGCGTDAAPYFRIFNPVLQGEKFDNQGQYVRHWIPELATLENRYIHKPWEAGTPGLAAAGVILGKDFPEPLVDLQDSRRRALNAWDQARHLHRN